MPNDYFDDVRSLLRNRYNQTPSRFERDTNKPDNAKRAKVARKLRHIAREAKRYNG